MSEPINDVPTQIYQSLLVDFTDDLKDLYPEAYRELYFHKREIVTWYNNRHDNEWFEDSVNRITGLLKQLDHENRFPITVDLLNDYLKSIGKEHLQLR